MINITLFSGFSYLLMAPLALGFVWLGLVTVIVLTAIILSSRESDFVWFTVIPIGFVFYFANLIPPFTLQEVLMFLLQYFVVGFSYSLLRWIVLCGKKAKILKDSLGKLRVRYNDHYSDKTFEEFLIDKNMIPTFSNSIHKLYFWMVWWPFSVVGFFFGQVLDNFGRFFLSLFKNFYLNIRIVIFSWYGIDKNILDTTPEKKKGI